MALVLQQNVELVRLKADITVMTLVRLKADTTLVTLVRPKADTRRCSVRLQPDLARDLGSEHP